MAHKTPKKFVYRKFESFVLKDSPWTVTFKAYMHPKVEVTRSGMLVLATDDDTGNSDPLVTDEVFARIEAEIKGRRAELLKLDDGVQRCAYSACDTEVPHDISTRSERTRFCCARCFESDIMDEAMTSYGGGWF